MTQRILIYLKAKFKPLGVSSSYKCMASVMVREHGQSLFKGLGFLEETSLTQHFKIIMK